MVECSHGQRKALGSSPGRATLFHLLHRHTRKTKVAVIENTNMIYAFYYMCHVTMDDHILNLCNTTKCNTKHLPIIVPAYVISTLNFSCISFVPNVAIPPMIKASIAAPRQMNTYVGFDN